MEFFKPPSRNQIAQMAGGNNDMIRALERLFLQAGNLTPTEINALIDLINGIDVQGKTSPRTYAELSLKGKKVNAIERGLLVFVADRHDFPRPVAGVITLADDVTYFVVTEVDLGGDRIVCGKNTAMIGGSAENSRIISTGLTAALITSLYSLTLHSVSFTASVVLDLNGVVGGQALDWTLVNFLDCPTIGTIKNYTNFIGTTVGVLNSANWIFDGEIGTVGFSGSIFVGIAGQTIVELPSTLTITRRFRVIYSAFVAFGGATALDVDTSATIPNTGYILDTCNFTGGATFVAGVQHDDNKALFINNFGIDNSADISNYYMNGNATATVITTINTPVKILGTTTSDAITQRFTNTNNKSEYVGAIDQAFKIFITASLVSTNNTVMALYVAKNGVVVPQSVNQGTGNAGGRADSIFAMAILDLTENDYIEAWVENKTNTQNITAENLNVIIERAS